MAEGRVEFSNIPPEVEQYIKALEAESEEWRRKYEYALEEIKELLHHRFGRSSERYIEEGQQELFTIDEAETVRKEEVSERTETVEVRGHRRRKAGRRPLPKTLPRVRIYHDIAEEDKVCGCGAVRQKIREERSERLAVIPEQYYVEEHIRPIYGCKRCEGSGDEGKPAMLVAPAVASLIPKSIVTPSLLATVIVNKYCDHMPYYRQARRFYRQGIWIRRQDMSNWTLKVYEKVKPLIELLEEEVRRGPLIQMDETPLQVMREANRENTAKSYMWLARGGPPGKGVVVYSYRESRSADFPKEFLSGYKGYVQCDGYESYESAVKGVAGIELVGCFAHVRRKYHKAWVTSNKRSEEAERGLKYVQRICGIEAELREMGLPDSVFVERRKAAVGPILESFRDWCLELRGKVAPQGLLGKAIGYTLGQWDKLVKYLEAAYITPTNNLAENAIRPFVLGRKNWLFSGSPEGAHASCAMYSLIETARTNKLNPYVYLEYLFDRLAYVSSEDDFEELLPTRIDREALRDFAAKNIPVEIN